MLVYRETIPLAGLESAIFLQRMDAFDLRSESPSECNPNHRSCELSAARTSVLEKELEVCQALHELEPQNKCESA